MPHFISLLLLISESFFCKRKKQQPKWFCVSELRIAGWQTKARDETQAHIRLGRDEGLRSCLQPDVLFTTQVPILFLPIHLKGHKRKDLNQLRHKTVLPKPPKEKTWNDRSVRSVVHEITVFWRNSPSKMTNREATGEQETALDFTLQAFYGGWKSWEGEVSTGDLSIHLSPNLLHCFRISGKKSLPR